MLMNEEYLKQLKQVDHPGQKKLIDEREAIYNECNIIKKKGYYFNLESLIINGDGSSYVRKTLQNTSLNKILNHLLSDMHVTWEEREQLYKIGMTIENGYKLDKKTQLPEIPHLYLHDYPTHQLKKFFSIITGNDPIKVTKYDKNTKYNPKDIKAKPTYKDKLCQVS